MWASSVLSLHVLGAAARFGPRPPDVPMAAECFAAFLAAAFFFCRRESRSAGRAFAVCLGATAACALLRGEWTPALVVALWAASAARQTWTPRARPAVRGRVCNGAPSAALDARSARGARVTDARLVRMFGPS